MAEANAADRRAWPVDGDDPMKDVNVLVIGEPANDATPANGGSGHAEKAAADSFNNVLLPYYAAWIAEAPKAQTAIHTIVANGPFIANNAAKHQWDFSLRYNELLRAAVQAGTIVAERIDSGAEARLQDPNDAAKFNPADKIHLVEGGNVIRAELDRAAIVDRIRNGGGTITSAA